MKLDTAIDTDSFRMIFVQLIVPKKKIIQISTRIRETSIPEFTRIPKKRATTELFIY